VCGYALAVLVLLLGARTVVRNPDWKNPAAALNALVRDHPESYRAQVALGNALASTDPARSRSYLEMAYRTWPDDPFLLLRLGRVELSANGYGRAAELLEKARRLAPFVHETEVSLAYAYMGLGRFADAMHALARAQRLGADRVTLLAIRAVAFEQQGRFAEAAGAWRAAAHADRVGTQFWQLLARSLARAGVTEAALAAVDTARARSGPNHDRLKTLAALEQAVRHGCYAAPPATSACEDPLASEILLLPGQELPSALDAR
jgi:predicted Zn-dependent protease